jgi:hypothetical protein
MNFYKLLSTFVGHFCPPGSGSGSGFRIRIRIHNPAMFNSLFQAVNCFVLKRSKLLNTDPKKQCFGHFWVSMKVWFCISGPRSETLPQNPGSGMLFLWLRYQYPYDTVHMSDDDVLRPRELHLCGEAERDLPGGQIWGGWLAATRVQGKLAYHLIFCHRRKLWARTLRGHQLLCW